METFAPIRGLYSCLNNTGDYVKKEDFMELYHRVKHLLDDFGILEANIAKDITELREYIDGLEIH